MVVGMKTPDGGSRGAVGALPTPAHIVPTTAAWISTSARRLIRRPAVVEADYLEKSSRGGSSRPSLLLPLRLLPVVCRRQRAMPAGELVGRTPVGLAAMPDMIRSWRSLDEVERTSSFSPFFLLTAQVSPQRRAESGERFQTARGGLGEGLDLFIGIGALLAVAG
jgi:hypothetical protein